ncbi:MAG: sigma-70 family RNA polymerase sigma factor [Azoarcus sp.]|jgi:RNA polymerase sigma-70 factor (ECF subfamily)|nr:sigma-70 family RNA polymerase sigma factor [Azoarcus sp.]
MNTQTHTPALADVSDKDLMAQIVQGNVSVPAAELYRRHNRALFNFVAWSCQGNSFEAEELCQKIWLKVMYCTHYQSASSFKTFLYQTAREVLTESRASAYDQQAIVGNDLNVPDADLTPEAESELRLNLHRVRRAFMELPTLLRETVALRFFCDLTLEEIAAATGTVFDTAKGRLRNAFAYLRRELGHA